MNKWRIENRFRLMKIKYLFEFVILILVLFNNVVGADYQGAAVAGALAESENASVYQGTLSGDWHGEVMGTAISGTFSITISAEGIVSGTFSGVQSGTITGTVSASGEINAKGSAGLSEWSGRLSISEGRLLGSGTWTGYGGGGLWSSS